MAEATEENFWIRSKGADMPVMVRGNRASGIYIIVNPGWPGIGLIYSVNEAFQELEKEYTLVYWNYRGAGTSTGNPGRENYRMDQFTEDTDLLVDTVRKLYGDPHIFMMGHSFGGEVSGNYLLSPERQAKIKAFIGVEPVLDSRPLDRKLLDDIIAYAETRLDDSYWKDAYDFCIGKKEITPKDSIIFDYAEKARIINFVGSTTSWYPELLRKSFTERYGNTSMIVTQFGMYNSFFTSDSYIDNLDSITLPTYLICGDYSKGGFGQEHMELLAGRLGTPAAEKELLYMENSGHLPFLSEPQLFATAVSSYIKGIMR